jgi:hypothetical protein
MRHRATWALSLALLAGLAAAAAAQEPAPPSPPPPSGSSWLPNLWPFGQPQRPPAPAPAPKTPPVDSAATQRARELAAWQRRVAVCFRLREIARQTNDDDLERRAEQLQDQAFAIYTQRIALLLADSYFQSDEQALTERLNAGPGDGRLVGGSAPRPGGSAFSQASPRGGRP